MKFTIIGDIHGRYDWKRIVSENMDSDKIIFLGDYHDIYAREFAGKDISLLKQNSITNLFEILDLKKLYPDKIILLLGNHDTHYMYDIPGCSRFDRENYDLLKSIFNNNKSLFQYAYQKGNHIFTHAGITASWFRTYANDLITNGLEADLNNLADVLNKWGDDMVGVKALNEISYWRGGFGNNGGPTWADVYEFKVFSDGPFNIVNGLHQYVGHNMVKKIITFESEDKNSSITFLDVLGLKTNDKKHLNIEI